jgi:hypothetical protein
MRFLEVPGPEIGAALADVNTHVSELGEDAWRSFGEPIAYAASLNLPRREPRKVYWEPACIVFQATAMWILCEAFWRMLRSFSDFYIQPPLVFLVLCLMVLMSTGDRVMRWIVHNSACLQTALLASAGIVGAMFFILWITGGAGWGELPLVWAWVVSGVFMVTGTLPLVISGRWGRIARNPIPVPDHPNPPRQLRGLIDWDNVFWFPVGAVVVPVIYYGINFVFSG